MDTMTVEIEDFGEITDAALEWPDPFGWRAKIGLIVPSTNTVNAPEWQLLAPEGVSVHVARTLVKGNVTMDSYNAMAHGTEKAAEELATADLDIIAYGCTSGSFMCSREEITGRITEIAGVPAVTTSDSILAAFRALGIRKLSLVTPYLRFVNEGEVRFLEDAGIGVVAAAGLGIGATEAIRHTINRVPHEMIRDLVLAYDRPEAEAIFVSCTALPSLPLVAELEEELGKPIITSNQATFWYVMRTLGLKDSITGYGKLLEAC